MYESMLGQHLISRNTKSRKALGNVKNCIGTSSLEPELESGHPVQIREHSLHASKDAWAHVRAHCLKKKSDSLFMHQRTSDMRWRFKV
jgi:hypothetical protein